MVSAPASSLERASKIGEMTFFAALESDATACEGEKTLHSELRSGSRVALYLLAATLVCSAVETEVGSAVVHGPPTLSYFVYVCAESDDEVALVRYGPDGLSVVKTITVGSFPAKTEGPHGITVDPSGRYWYVTISHGFPFGSVHKYETETDQLISKVGLGMFPATLDMSVSTGLLFVVNFDLHGPVKPSTISVVEAETMTEVDRIPTGIMPHGSRFSPDGIRHYSVGMMSDELVEVDGLEFTVRRTLALSPDAAYAHAGGLPPDGVIGVVQPTWVTRPTGEGKVYVAGNAVDEIYEIDIDEWRVTRTFDAGPGPYNLDVTADGSTLVATYKKGAAVGFWDLESGRERVRTSTSRTIPHGIVLTPDGRFAFVTLEGVGSEPGTIEVYEVTTGDRVGAVDVGKQAGGIAFWKAEP